MLGYTHEGFLIQNSWGRRWGGVDFDDVSYRGCALWRYDDFDFNVWDLWVARLARPLDSLEALARSSERRAEVATGSPPVRKGPARLTVRDHYIHVDDGAFDPHGDYWSSPGETRRIVREAVASGAKHLLFYGHGGLESVDDAARRVALWRPVFRANGIHEIHFIWETGLWEELGDILRPKEEMTKRRVGGFLSDWWDKSIERVTGRLGHSLWKEMRTDADIAFDDD